MVIQFVGAHEALGDSISVTNAIGDLIVLYLVRTGSTAQPTLAGEIRGLVKGGGGGTWAGIFSYNADAANMSFSGFTSVTQIVAGVYRSTDGKLMIATRSSNLASGTSGPGGIVTYPALNELENLSQRWQVGLIIHRDPDVDVHIPPSGMVNRIASSYTSGRIALHDTSGVALSWPSTTYTLTTGASNQWRSGVAEIAELPWVLPSGGGVARPSHPLFQQVIG